MSKTVKKVGSLNLKTLIEEDKLTFKDYEILSELVKSVHLEKKEIRFWASPDNQNTWRTLLLADVDLINTDNIEQYKKFITLKNSDKDIINDWNKNSRFWSLWELDK